MLNSVYHFFLRLVLVLVLCLQPVAPLYAQVINSQIVTHSLIGLSPAYVPPLLKGIIIDPENAFRFDFILDAGDEDLDDEATRSESQKLIKYFLAALTIPQDDLWVNLSPDEPDRIIASEFGKTEMGRTMLAQDYLLKRLTASLLYPEGDVGRKLWQKIRRQAKDLFGMDNVPTDIMHRIWIVPDGATIYENQDRAYITQSYLKVMLEEEYLASQESGQWSVTSDQLKGATTEIIHEIIIPAIATEVNHGKNFAELRQIYHSFILASWYKENLKESLLNRGYADQRKVEGIDEASSASGDQIYQQYLDAFRSGVYEIIKEEYDPATQEITARKYISGGIGLTAKHQTTNFASLFPVGDIKRIVTNLEVPAVSQELSQLKQTDNAAFQKADIEKLIPVWIDNPEEVSEFIWLRFKDRSEEALSMIGSELFDRSRWDLVDRLLADERNLSLGIMAELLRYRVLRDYYLTFEILPQGFQDLIIKYIKLIDHTIIDGLWMGHYKKVYRKEMSDYLTFVTRNPKEGAFYHFHNGNYYNLIVKPIITNIQSYQRKKRKNSFPLRATEKFSKKRADKLENREAKLEII